MTGLKLSTSSYARNMETLPFYIAERRSYITLSANHFSAFEEKRTVQVCSWQHNLPLTCFEVLTHAQAAKWKMKPLAEGQTWILVCDVYSAPASFLDVVWEPVPLSLSTVSIWPLPQNSHLPLFFCLHCAIHPCPKSTYAAAPSLALASRLSNTALCSRLSRHLLPFFSHFHFFFFLTSPLFVALYTCHCLFSYHAPPPPPLPPPPSVCTSSVNPASSRWERGQLNALGTLRPTGDPSDSNPNNENVILQA